MFLLMFCQLMLISKSIAASNELFILFSFATIKFKIPGNNDTYMRLSSLSYQIHNITIYQLINVTYNVTWYKNTIHKYTAAFKKNSCALELYSSSLNIFLSVFIKSSIL